MDHVLTPVSELIPESNITIFSPHFDDVLFMLGGYLNEMKKLSLLHTKHFHIIIIFSRSNYLAGSGNNNFDTSLNRVKLATGKRLLEDMECLDELIGRFTYSYQLLGENECFTRGKNYAASEMEFPHGMYDDFNHADREIFERMKAVVYNRSQHKDTALIFPMAFKEHIDHFIVREAALEVAKGYAVKSNASFYFQEDKPYAGIASPEEHDRIASFIYTNHLQPKTYCCDPEEVISYAFRYYISQVEEIYKTGIRERAYFLQRSMSSHLPCDRLHVYQKQ